MSFFQYLNRGFLPVAAALSICVLSCKKDSPAASTQVVTGTTDLRDTLLKVARFDYLWNSNIPASFSAHSYSSTDTLGAELESIKSYSPLNSTTGTHYDHFSFILTEADYKTEFPLAAVPDAAANYGMRYAFDRSGNLRVSYSAHASTAYKQGIRRSWEITSVSGVTVATDAATVARLNAALNANTATFVFKNPSTGASLTLNLTRENIVDDEVIVTKVFTESAKKVGYIAYNTFITPLGANGNVTHAGLDTAFTKLSTAGITDLVIDLRYNGGGYVEIAEQMDDAIIPLANNNKVLYTEQYNDTLNKYYKAGHTSLDHDITVNINKTNSQNPAALTLNSVSFIVSNNTASAAELVINNLLPYFPGSKIIGLGRGLTSAYQNTAGKPFGYAGSFSIPTKNPVFEAFILNFETRNANGVGGYVSGLVPDIQEYDGVEYDFGDPSEDGLKAALNYQATGHLSYVKNSSQLAVGSNARAAGSGGISLNPSIHQPLFQGMFLRMGKTNTSRQNLNFLKSTPALRKQ